MRAKRESDGRQLDHQTLQAMRQRAVKAVREGRPPAEVAKVLGMNRRTIYRWIATFNEGGQNALLARPIPGRPSVLTEAELEWLYRNISNHSPQQFQFDFGPWTISLIRHLIEYHLGKKLSPATLHRVVLNLGFTPQKPLYRAWQQDDALVNAWEIEIFPKIRARAKAEGATIYFANEAGLRSDYHTGTTWSLRGSTPVVRPTGRCFSLNMLSAVAGSENPYTSGALFGSVVISHDASQGAPVHFSGPLPRLVVNDGSSTDAQKTRLTHQAQSVLTVYHRFALSNPALLSARSKKLFSKASCPILACNGLRSTSGAPRAPDRLASNTCTARSCN